MRGREGKEGGGGKERRERGKERRGEGGRRGGREGRRVSPDQLSHSLIQTHFDLPRALDGRDLDSQNDCLHSAHRQLRNKQRHMNRKM